MSVCKAINTLSKAENYQDYSKEERLLGHEQENLGNIYYYEKKEKAKKIINKEKYIGSVSIGCNISIINSTIFLKIDNGINNKK